MRASIEIDGALTIPRQEMHVESDHALAGWVDVAPDPNLAQAAQGIVGAVRAALVFFHHRNAVRVVAIGLHPGGIVDRHLCVVGKFGAWPALRTIFVIQRRPLSGKIHLRVQWSGHESRAQQKQGECGSIRGNHRFS